MNSTRLNNRPFFIVLFVVLFLPALLPITSMDSLRIIHKFSRFSFFFSSFENWKKFFFAFSCSFDCVRSGSCMFVPPTWNIYGLDGFLFLLFRYFCWTVFFFFNFCVHCFTVKKQKITTTTTENEFHWTLLSISLTTDRFSFHCIFYRR